MQVKKPMPIGTFASAMNAAWTLSDRYRAGCVKDAFLVVSTDLPRACTSLHPAWRVPLTTMLTMIHQDTSATTGMSVP